MDKQFLTIFDVLHEDDAFRYSYNYPDWIETIFNIEDANPYLKRPVNAIKTNRPEKTPRKGV